MMIGPGNFVAENIEGKTREEAVKEVKRLWREIRRLRKMLEEESQAEEMMYHPSPEVRISVYHDYIEAAKAYFKEQGWEYEPSKEEIKDREFNDRLDQVEKIEVEYGGFLCGHINLKISFDGDEVKTDRVDMIFPLDPEGLNRTYFEGVVREELLDEIRELHMGEWSQNYDDPCVLDGIQWSVEFKYADGKKRIFEGSNKYPYNFDRFLDVMEIEPIDD